MTHNLERRLSRELLHYCFLDPQFYDDLKHYVPSDTVYRDVVESLLPENWNLQLESLWYIATQPCAALPTQGYKIHLSATTACAATLLQRVVPILILKQASFKFVSDPVMLDYHNSKHYPRGSSGKFVTIYPTDVDSCAALLEDLHEATRDLTGPHILSDRPVHGSKTVFYRYGGFLPQHQLTLYGERAPMILGPAGTWIPDLRGPTFELPPGMSDPFQERSPASVDPPLLHGRFVVESSESFSNAGGVYKGQDTLRGACVLIKEARPGTCTRIDSPGDATDTLAMEYKVLLALQPTGCVPEAIDYFQEWDHHFLVEEYVQGIPLANYRALEDKGLLTYRAATASRVADFCERLRRIATNLIEAVEACHKSSVVLGDLAPDNIIIDDKSLAIRLIDFESATILADVDDTRQPGVFTPGFASPSRRLGKPATFADDWYSLGAVIYSLILPLQSFFFLQPDAQDKFLDELAEDQGLPQEIALLISALFKADVLLAKRLVEKSFSPPRKRFSIATLPSDHAMESVVSGIARHILASKDVSRSDRLFPSDYRLFSTNPLSISFGAIGQALYLKATLGGIPNDVQDWILGQPVTCENYTPGLYIGLAGVSWGLAELGLEDAAYEAMSEAHKSPLLHQGTDIFYGCAGTGLADLFWWHRTGQLEFLEEARRSGDHLLRTAVEDPSGYYWLNIDGAHHFGYAHGGSGIALFLLYLYQASQDRKYLKYAIGGLDYEIAHAREEDEYLIWSRSKDSTSYSPYWRYGNAGIGSVLIRFYAILGDETYLHMAARAVHYAANKFAVIPGQFMGLSGMGEFLLDMYRFTGDEHYWNEAAKIAGGVLLYAVEDAHGTAFPGEDLMRLSTDYGTGSAGIGLFLKRLIHPSTRLLHDILSDNSVLRNEGEHPRSEKEKAGAACTKY